MKAYERFLKYAKIHTTSDGNSGTHPSSSIQFDLANHLVDELKDLGVCLTSHEHLLVVKITVLSSNFN